MQKVRMKTVGIWVLALSLFAFQLFFRTLGHADGAPSWQKTVAKSGECHIYFPSVPQKIEQTLPLADGVNRLSYDVYLAPHEDKGVYLLLIATYPMPLSGGHEVAGLEGLLSGIVNHNPENNLVYADLIDKQGHPTVDFLVEGGTSYFRGQALMVENKLYLVAMEGIKGNMDEKAFERFLKSFKLLP